MELDFSVIFDYKAALLFGLLLTLKLTAICVVLGCALG
ncbi:amino acid ABC transporter permease, partial [Pseudomonas sp. HMWF011]